MTLLTIPNGWFSILNQKIACCDFASLDPDQIKTVLKNIFRNALLEKRFRDVIIPHLGENVVLK